MFTFRSRHVVVLIASLLAAERAGAEILVRWNVRDIPLKEHLGVAALVVPAANSGAIHDAWAQGIRVLAEIDVASVGTFVPSKRLSGVVVAGDASPEQLAGLRKRFGRRAREPRLLSIRKYGVWPHIRSNVVTTRNDVLQVGSRTAQPWLDHNVALVRAAAAVRISEAVLSYRWQPSTVSEAEQGPALEDYLVAIAEAGSFGGDLVLPLHERLQKGLLLGKPAARAWWREIRRYIDFYSWSPPARYRRIANIGVVTADPAGAIDITRLLIRHNLPFEFIAPDRVAHHLTDMRLLIVPEPPADVKELAEFTRLGGTLMVAVSPEGTFPWRAATAVKSDDRATYSYGEGRVVELLKRIADPNTFALEARDLLGREHRVIDLWNGITVLAAPYVEPGRNALMVALVNYAHDPESVQVRVPGTYSVVEYESPETEPALLPYTHRNGYTEFVLPALRVGGRVFLSKQAGLE